MRTLSSCFVLAGVVAQLSAGPAVSQTPPIVFVYQGQNWSDATRLDFYGRDQGSRLIPLGWLRSLKQPNGQPFLADSLARYGYLPNPANTDGLPVGFNATGDAKTVGMTCAACHTRQIAVAGTSYRIDGGPAIVDFQSFVQDLDVAVGNLLASDAAFAPFAAAVLNAPAPSSAAVSSLRQDVNAWYLRYHTLITRALPKPPASAWGPARLDAVGMIFNELTGLDLGPAPSFLISDNIKVADAPVRYPFLWNAARQDHTQWPGFADNGDDILGLSRNLGEVYGVFGIFEPKQKCVLVICTIDYLDNNSANWEGLSELEHLITQIGPPKWPWQVDTTRAARGKAVYENICASCHGVQPGEFRLPPPVWQTPPFGQTFLTPIQNVGTDTREGDILTWSAKTGVLNGAFNFATGQTLGETDSAFNILAASVIGSILDRAAKIVGVARSTGESQPLSFSPTSNRLPAALQSLQGAFRYPSTAGGTASESTLRAATPNALLPGAPSAPQKGAYEARVMEGIWAAAPYLHNGSVPTLAELLKPAKDRVPRFRVGPAYDLDNIGLAVEQTQFGYEFTATPCSDLNSGNSNCGHEYGTQLNAEDKKALLEYLKTL